MRRRNVRLVRPALELEPAYMAMLDDFKRDTSPHGFSLKQVEPGEFADHVARLQAQERGEGLPEGFVPQTTFWLVRDTDIIGVARLRHALTPDLQQAGGNIGFAIRPSERGRGYGTYMLKLVLKEAKALRLKRVLLTCDPENAASARVMLKNGAVQGMDSVHPETGKSHSRFWIRV